MTEVAIIHGSMLKTAVCKNGGCCIHVNENSMVKIDLFKSCLTHINIMENRLLEKRLGKRGLGKVTVSMMDLLKKREVIEKSQEVKFTLVKT